MSTQKFTAFQREAIWLAHNKKCAYTRELIDFSDFHIDHIIPEYLIDEPIEIRRLKSMLKLTEDFDINGYENILPCRAGANLQKGSLVFDLARTHFFLGIAKSKKAVIQKNIENIDKRKSRGKALVLLQQCLERGELLPSEVARILEDYSEQPQEIFNLIEGLQLLNAEDIKTVAKADIANLMSRKVLLGQNNHGSELILTNDHNEKVHVCTCKEYVTAIKSEYYPRTSIDIKMSAIFEHQCGLLCFLQNAKIAEYSFINEPRVGIVDLHLIPFSFFPVLCDPPLDTQHRTTYQSKVDDGTIVIKRLKQNMLCIEEQGGMGQQLIEVTRADFNGNGMEDMLLFEYSYSTQGTFGFGKIRILTRNSINGLFEPIL